jgi:hypothetical protein
MVEFEGSLVVLAVSVLVGGLAIHVGAIVALAARNYTHAVVTAAMGGVAWWLTWLAFADLNVPRGPLSTAVALVVWVAVLRYRYETGWIRAATIGVFASLAGVVVLTLLAAVGVDGVDPLGIP